MHPILWQAIMSLCCGALPDGFVYPDALCGNIILEIRYYTSYNFIGERLDGYEAPRAVLAEQAAIALCEAAAEFEKLGFAIKIYDAYRPQSAVDHFLRWGSDKADCRMKDIFYPDISKEDIFTLDYISPHSAHSRGSAVDMTLIGLRTGKETDMGGVFDFFGPVSAYDASGISWSQRENRMLMRRVMTECGFEPEDSEWWHFRLSDEPYPDTAFDFPIR